MTQTRTAGKDAGKKTRQADSRYYTAGVLRKTGENLTSRGREYKARYIQKPVKSGKAFIEELGDNPRKTITSLADESRESFEGLRKDARKKVAGYIQDGRNFYRRARKDPRGSFESMVADGKGLLKDLGSDAQQLADDLIQGGREMVAGLEKDTRLVADRLVASGKKAIEKLPGQVADKGGETLLIKKYVNGRFYDTVNKKYLTKDALVRLVKQHKKIRIIATKTGKNITRAVISELAVETQGGESFRLSADQLVNWVKENQKRVRVSVRNLIKFPA